LSIAAAAVGALIGAGCTEKVTSGEGGNGGNGGDGGGGYGNNGAEYGMPHAHYVVSGSVADEHGDPIEGIELTLDPTSVNYSTQTTTSEVDGSWTITTQGHFCHPDCTIEAEDVDGVAHGGLFETAFVPITLEQTDPGSGVWDEGTWEAHDVDIALELESGGAGSGQGGQGGSGAGGQGGSGAGGWGSGGNLPSAR